MLGFIGHKYNYFILLFILIIFVVVIPISYSVFSKNTIEAQKIVIASRYSLLSDKKSVYLLLNDSAAIIKSFKDDMPESHQCFVNFYSLACRYSGYIGPMEEAYWDPVTSIKNAVKAGCRTFVIEIDYIDECTGEKIQYYPRVVVRDVQGKLRIDYKSSHPICNSARHSSIQDVCNKINEYAFSKEYCNNTTDPVVIVLYFLRQPCVSNIPLPNESPIVLEYYSNVAKALSCFQDRLLTNELDGGIYYRQKQESRLLVNNISEYANKVLVFSNANTSGFRQASYSSGEDLDFIVNLRLACPSTGLVDTEIDADFGTIDVAEYYTIIPDSRRSDIIKNTKLNWRLSVSSDPFVNIDEKMYKLMNTFGVNCTPITLYDTKNDFMFSDNLFKFYSYIPKPLALRYIKAPDIIPMKLTESARVPAIKDMEDMIP